MIEEILAKPVTSLAYGWRLERRDGVTLGFTSHDRDIEVGGLLMRASPGMEPTSIVEKMGLEEGGLDVRGALTANAFTIRDMEAGRWDGAGLSVFSFDWTEPNLPIRPLASGRLGTISWSGDQFETVFNGPGARLDGPAAPFTTPTCRAAFCGAECGLNRMCFVRELTVISLNGETANLAAGTTLPADVYAFGTLRWLEGANCGSTSDILGNDFPFADFGRASPLCNRDACKGGSGRRMYQNSR